jgi:hypothetical protein
MKHLKIAGLALAIVLALSAIAAASASAAGELELVNSAGKEPTKKHFTGEGGEITFETVGGRKLTCTKTKVEGTIKGTKEAEVTSTSTGCKSGSVACNTSGAASGEARMGISYFWGWLYSNFHYDQGWVSSFLPFGIATVSIDCTSLETLTLKDGVVGSVSELELGKLTKEFTVKASETKGEQEATEYKLIDSEEASAKEAVGMTKGEGLEKFEYERTGEKTAGIKLKFEEEVKLVEN